MGNLIRRKVIVDSDIVNDMDSDGNNYCQKEFDTGCNYAWMAGAREGYKDGFDKGFRKGYTTGYANGSKSVGNINGESTIDINL